MVLTSLTTTRSFPESKLNTGAAAAAASHFRPGRLPIYSLSKENKSALTPATSFVRRDRSIDSFLRQPSVRACVFILFGEEGGTLCSGVGYIEWGRITRRVKNPIWKTGDQHMFSISLKSLVVVVANPDARDGQKWWRRRLSTLLKVFFTISY